MLRIFHYTNRLIWSMEREIPAVTVVRIRACSDSGWRLAVQRRRSELRQFSFGILQTAKVWEGHGGVA